MGGRILHEVTDIEDETSRSIFMNKKILVSGIALLMLCFVAAVAFAADGAQVSYTSNSVTVKNTGSGTLKQVDVCVIYKDSQNERHETNMPFYGVTSKGQTEPFPKAVGTVIGAYSTVCIVEIKK
jgi:hypothetical protein